MQLHFMTRPQLTAPQRSSDIKCVMRSYPYAHLTKDTMYCIENSLCNFTPNALFAH